MLEHRRSREDELRALLKPGFRKFVRERMAALGIETLRKLADEAKREAPKAYAPTISYNAIANALNEKRDLPGRKLCDALRPVLSKGTRDAKVLDPWLACELYFWSGSYWFEDPVAHHVDQYKPGDWVYSRLPHLAFIRDTAPRGFGINPEKLAKSIRKSATQGVTYVFIQNDPAEFRLGQQALIKALPSSSTKWKKNVYWVKCNKPPALSLMPAIGVLRPPGEFRWMLPVLSETAGHPGRVFPCAFQHLHPIQEACLTAQIQPVRELVSNPDATDPQDKGFEFVRWGVDR